ncbi:heavy metal translocating P-type ATPase [Staphylococcus pseudintermedius]|uniref:heavy metal translocating P-type ATPase n=1 Tax=Staphylococcus pseudintermedius TaxID=283734 RepID=UPI001BDF6539|nr:heavy metal translocating P-type ATPase [Staphylococcus pseudintermedius]MDT0806357.1 heavy metal translocating P-type ATPase [Staphylococcus pseudintermedius]MDT0817065.1 heavy metal translocating P-type ATPase [Staphylococcus pseudintermedius]MDT0882727.1 heavy metal translocating P-type ATPase [Staphylococcus pseudintermedius]MDT0910002.1 heavy metal translocating P-type ATPase [Staphylococcus pseudintermedius]MDT0920931.1 heavy metal translocating P-type ATPase [Staphylococcus pseudinte
MENNQEHHHHQHMHESHHPHSHHIHHDDHAHHHHGNFKMKFFVSLIFAIPIIIFSPMMGVQLPFQFTFPGSDWMVLILATILFIYGGQPFLVGAKGEIASKKPGMMTLVTLGISVAYIYSLYAFYLNHFSDATGHTMDFFWELATLILIMLLGHWVEMNAVGSAGDALKKMAALLPNKVIKVTNNQREEVKISDIALNDIVEVKAGESIPTDGMIVRGETAIDESLVTGESKKVQKKPNDQVIGGSINGFGTIQVKVTAVGEASYLSQVMDIIKQAQNDKSRAELLSDKVAGYLFYFAISVGMIAFIIWMLIDNHIDFALERLVTVLVIACPHALGLAIPLVTARSTSIGARHGLMIKNRSAIETAQHIDYVMMDKTGTLTEGHFSVNHYESFKAGVSDEIVLSLFASLESQSNHPLATSIVDFAKNKNIAYAQPQDVQNISGIGLEGKVGDQTYKITNVTYLEQNGFDYDQALFTKLAQQGNSISYLIDEQQVIGIIAQGDQIKESSKQMVTELLVRGITPVILTGDNLAVAETVAEALGIQHVHAQLMPADKERMIKDYQKQGKKVMMVGDGINDAPSLIRADIGVAIGAGTDVAIDSGDVILVKSDPSDIIHFFTLSKRTMRKMVQNLWWGAGYNIVAVPLAAGILASIGLILSPAVGAILMSLSTVIVAINAFTLKLE